MTMKTTPRLHVPIKVKRLTEDAAVPRYAREMDAGFDLVAAEDVIVQPGQTAKVRTGLAFSLPDGYELQIRPRSGISAKTKLRVSNPPGTVDAGYRGEVCVLIDNIKAPSGVTGSACWDVTESVVPVDREVDRNAYVIRKGDRIAQGVLAAVPMALFEEVKELDETERGSGGFGSSGVN